MLTNSLKVYKYFECFTVEFAFELNFQYWRLSVQKLLRQNFYMWLCCNSTLQTKFYIRHLHKT